MKRWLGSERCLVRCPSREPSGSYDLLLLRELFCQRPARRTELAGRHVRADTNSWGRGAAVPGEGVQSWIVYFFHGRHVCVELCYVALDLLCLGFARRVLNEREGKAHLDPA